MLLSKSADERLKYFKELTIGHPFLAETFEKLWRAVKDPNPGSIVLVYGPAGVGKSTLCKHLEKKLKEEYAGLLEEDREMIPLVKVEARSPANGNFDWKHLFREILIELAEPAVEQKIDMNKWRGLWESYLLTANNSRTPTAKLQDVLEEALRHRTPKGVLIDEAHHICIVPSGRRLVIQPESIKSIANRTETTHILFGSYDLLTLRNLNGQLARRTVDLHFKRYNSSNPEELEIFINVLEQFQKHLPLEKTPDLVSCWEYIYSRSIGATGIVKDWLYAALSAALREGSRSLKMQHLENTALSVSQADRLIDEALAGEQRLREEEETSSSRLAGKLGLIKIIRPDGEIREAKQKRKFSDVGMRNPKRDTIGQNRKCA